MWRVKTRPVMLLRLYLIYIDQNSKVLLWNVVAGLEFHQYVLFKIMCRWQVKHTFQGWFWVCPQPVRGIVILWRHLSLVGCKPRISPAYLHDCGVASIGWLILIIGQNFTCKQNFLIPTKYVKDKNSHLELQMIWKQQWWPILCPPAYQLRF